MSRRSGSMDYKRRQMNVRFIATAAIALAFLTPCHAHGGVTEIFLKAGATAGDGSKARPFGTFAEAQGAVRKAVADDSLPPGKVVVVVHDGTYRVNKAVEFSKADSGTEAHPVVWRAENKGKVRITGGIPVPKLSPLTKDDPNWSRIQVSARSHVMVADLKAAGITDYGEVKTRGFGGPYMQLAWGGRYLALARWPNEGYAKIADAPPSKDADGKRIYSSEFKYEGDRPSRWTVEPDACMNGFFYHWWVASHVAIGSIDSATHTIRQKMKPGIDADRHKRPTIGSFSGYRKGMPWFGYNLLCELDTPGEYYIDRALGRLYVWPPEGTASGAAELSMSSSIISLNGVSNMTLSGFVFENCRDSLFVARGCDNVDVVACVMRNSGGRGATMEQCQDCRIAGCDIEWCNAGGALISGGDPKTLTHGNVVVENCHIHHYALTELTYCAAVEMQGCGLAARHNTIHEGPHVAILLRNPSRESEVSWNEIHSVCQESGEMGAVYAGCDWALCGNRVEANWLHDIYTSGGRERNQPNRAVMIDDGGAGFTISSNWFVRVTEGVSLSAIGNAVENNVFIDCARPITTWQAWKSPEIAKSKETNRNLLDRLAEISVHDEPWKSRYPYLGLIDDAVKSGRVRDPATRSVIRRNVWANAKGDFILFYCGGVYDGLYSPAAWIVEDNVEAGNSDPERFGQMPPLYRIGVQNSSDRATWPVLHSVSFKGGKLDVPYYWERSRN